MAAEACANSCRRCPVTGSGVSPNAMSASVASIMKSPTRVRSEGALRGSGVEEDCAGRDAAGSVGGDGVPMVSRRRRSVTRNPSSGASTTGASLAYAQTPAV